MSKQNLEMLEEIFKGAKMGMNATKLVDVYKRQTLIRPIKPIFVYSLFYYTNSL